MNICLPANGKVFKTDEQFVKWAKKNHHLDMCPTDLEGWMESWGAFYTTAKRCHQKITQKKTLSKRSKKAWANYTACTKTRCRDVDAAPLRKQIMKKCKHSENYTRKYFKCFEKEGAAAGLPQKEKLATRCENKQCGTIKKRAIQATHKEFDFIRPRTGITKERTEEACSV
jgi:hypothetical protein